MFRVLRVVYVGLVREFPSLGFWAGRVCVCWVYALCFNEQCFRSLRFCVIL